MDSTTQQIDDYTNSKGFSVIKSIDKLMVGVGGVVYMIQSLGAYFRCCDYSGVSTLLKSQRQVVAWLDMRW